MIDDEKIIEMFFGRSEQGIRELDIKYGKVCHNLSYHIVGSRQDAEECVNDAYLGAWNAIPPARPNPLLSYLVKIVRNISLKIYWRKEAAKRSSHYTIALEEIEACIAAPNTVEAEIEAKELARIIEAFLDTLTTENRVIFMRRYWFSDAMSELDTKYVDEALNYKKKAKKPIWVKWGAIAACLCLMIPLTAFAVDIIQYNAAVDYLNSLGIAVEDLSDYSHKEIKEAAKTIDAGESNPLTEEILSLIPENKKLLDTPTQVTSEQIKELTPTMTREDVLSLLGDTQDVGSGIYIYLYEVDQQYLLRIPFASDEAQLGVTGEDLLKALVPISGDIAPMVYVNDTLYQIVDSQPNFADEKSSFNLLGKIENTVSSSEEPKENFQANDDIVGAAVYQYGDNIVVEFEGKYWLYEHYHNTDFDGNSD